MRLICPECGEQIAAENINVQQMIAVCSACDTVFRFDPPESKIKRRKVRQPEHLTLRDTDDLHLAYRTNFRLDKNETFISSAIGSVFLTFVTVMLTGKYLSGETSVLIPIAFGLVAVFLYYWLALIVFNKTHIDMDDDTISVSRKPVPGLFNQPHAVNLSGIVAIQCEETPASKKEAYDTPRYSVWAEREDSSRKIVVTDVTEEYAFFIAQRLEERLDDDTDLDVAHLEDLGQGVDEVIGTSQAIEAQQNHP